MNHSVKSSEASHSVLNTSRDAWADEVEDDDFKPLTREEARQWRKGQSQLSMWAVLRWQIVIAVLAVGVSAVVTADAAVMRSVLYGSTAVIVPTAMVAWRSNRQAARGVSVGAQALLLSFFVWEGVRLLLAVALLAAAPLVLADVNWLALVAGFVLVIKAYGLVFYFHAKRQR